MKADVADKRLGLLGVLSAAGAFFGRILLPLGLFSVLAVGLHVGSDKVDDFLFVVFSDIDSLADFISSLVIQWVGGLFSMGDPWIDAWSLRAAELVDMESKAFLARWGALIVELAADFVLALPVLFGRAELLKPKQLVELIKKSYRDPTVLK